MGSSEPPPPASSRVAAVIDDIGNERGGVVLGEVLISSFLEGKSLHHFKVVEFSRDSNLRTSLALSFAFSSNFRINFPAFAGKNNAF